MTPSSPVDIISSQQKFEANELPTLLETIREKYPNCKVLLQTQIAGRLQQRIVFFQQGGIAFCSDREPKLDVFVDLLRHKIGSDWIDRIFESSQVNLNEEMTPKYFCDRLLQMRVIKTNDLIKTLLSSFLLSFEPLWSASGTLTVTPLPNQNNHTSLEWRIFRAAIEKRNRIWQKFTELTDGVNSVPIITESGFKVLQASSNSGDTEDKILRFIEQSINGRSDISTIAKKQKVDPLSIAQSLVKCIELGWVGISDDNDAAYAQKKRGNVLVIDDNPTTRKLLVTILQEFYDTHATAGSLGAVSLIPSKQIDLVIVSQSVATSTSLQLCKVIRQNSSYQNMPFLVISSKENFFERAKAKMVGVTEFLTQPLDRTKILYALDFHMS